MKVLITGVTGFIGSNLSSFLTKEGHTVVGLSRNAESAKRRVPSLQQAFEWQPVQESPPLGAFEGVGAIVNLVGETVAGRWTAGKKQKIAESRIIATRHLVNALGRLNERPKVLVSSSAIGYYGERGDEEINEDAPPGTDWLAKTTADWEHEATRAAELGLRVVRLRTSIVLGHDGALKPLLPQFKLGMGSILGSGRQWWAWVHIDDVVGLIDFALNSDFDGPINNAAPNPVTQREFAKTLGKVLGRPVFMPAPAFMLKLVLGEFSNELLGSKRVVPSRTQELGYRFKFPELEPALRDILSKG